MIYLIGGVARSGKTTVRKEILQHRRISGLETDSLRTVFELALPELEIHHDRPPIENAVKMAPFTRAFIKSRLFFEEDFVFEGDCLLPSIMSEFKDDPRIATVFLGYPNTTVEAQFDRLTALREGWLREMSDADIRKKLAQFISDSAVLEEQCLRLNIPFLDVSTLTLEEVIDGTLSRFFSQA